MVKISFPDGSVKEYPAFSTGLDIAQSISKTLAKSAIAIRINGDSKDLLTPIENDCKIEIITHDSEEGLDILRHDAAHIMAQAVSELFPGTQATIGPVIEDGFFMTSLERLHSSF